MDTEVVSLLEPDHPRAQEFRFALFKDPTIRPIAVLFFNSRRWEQAVCVALLSSPVTDKPLGMGMLIVQNGAASAETPVIASIWVAFDCLQREEYALLLLRSLAEESVTRYHVPARFEVLSLRDHRLLQRALEMKFPLYSGAE